MIPKGKGPGEILNLNISLLKAGKDFIAVYAQNEKKTALYDLNGNFEEEFLNGGYEVRSMAMADKQTYYFEIYPGLGYLFLEVGRKPKHRSSIRRRFQHQSKKINILAYTGKIVYHNGSLYFGGYSEPLIRRYDVSDKKVKLVWSRSVIDAYNSKNNYQKPKKGSEFDFFGYTKNAQFASWDIAVDDNYVYSVRASNGKKDINIWMSIR